MMLMVNSRIPYRELAELFNMSVNSIHKRIKSMVELKIIEKFVTHLSFRAFNPIPLNFVMFGMSKTKNPRDLIEKLGKNENIYNVSYHSGNFFAIHAHLRDPNQLDPLVSSSLLAADISLEGEPDQARPQAPFTKGDESNLVSGCQ